MQVKCQQKRAKVVDKKYCKMWLMHLNDKINFV